MRKRNNPNNAWLYSLNQLSERSNKGFVRVVKVVLQPTQGKYNTGLGSTQRRQLPYMVVYRRPLAVSSTFAIHLFILFTLWQTNFATQLRYTYHEQED